MIGPEISHYKVLGKLGGGGMGDVYRVHDKHLDRDVALKVLPVGTLDDDTARGRFRREALTLSKLNHPNIAVVYDFDSENGVDFLTMEYVAGETLAAKLMAGPLPESEIIRLGTQIAEALEEAHEHRIVHRDLKPGNVMVTPKGRVKVLDFGIAKLIRQADEQATTESVALTRRGAVVGTVPYMAPEQLQGKPADQRTDIYAFGAVLYEMATGKRLFPEIQTNQLIAAILMRNPQPPRNLNAQVSLGLQAIILKSIEKDPDKRYQSSREILQDLERLSIPGALVGTLRLERPRWVIPVISTAAVLIIAVAIIIGLNLLNRRSQLLKSPGTPENVRTSTVPQIRSIAVLPLENLSGDATQNYFADGMTEELITDLAGIGDLKVISRSSTMQYKGTRKPIPQIAKELKVDAVIGGSVLREGDRVRITAQLIDAKSEQDIWADSYERELKSVLALQGEIASTVADKVRVTLTSTERSRLANARPVNPQAYDAYLKGMQYWYKATPKDWDTALEYFHLALKADPNSARAYAGICHVWGGRAQFGVVSRSEAEPKQKAAAQKALELDSNLPEVHFVLANVKTWTDWDWNGGEQEFKKSIELNPNYADARAYYSHLLMTTGRSVEGIRQMERALELDPLNGLYKALYAVDLTWIRKYDDAIEQAKLSLQTTPKNPVAHCILSPIYHRKGMDKEALQSAKGCMLYGDVVNKALDQGYAEGGYTRAMRQAADAIVALSRTSSVSRVDIANCYLEAGEKAKALEWLEKAFLDHDPNMPYLGLPFYDSLRPDPRFQALLRKMNLPQN